ncbi:heavy-metal-associated domain-containing protein [Bizionia arctica]|uniref:Heavy-metal-associated domain-containing protein n=1 Tax=Bizionia arctica TaxID=1495645 RepID=A0A917GK54_9FLAO|nr:heavy-metal-associated domain-containing protein [Bizionia arctica]GGG49190.1 hypothetical protein GCM10010976_20640 [Bizionia arctica]
MSLQSENVIPGNHGKVFGTNANEVKDLQNIKDKLLLVHGIKDVILNLNIYPKEFTIHTTTLVEIKTIEDEVKRMGFHAIPKGIFPL